MPQTYKNLGQVNPSATTLTTLYTVPASTQTVVSTIFVAETNGAAATFRISVQVAGAGDNIKQYICYGVALAANETKTISGLALGAGDIIKVYASTANVSFSAFGVEII